MLDYEEIDRSKAYFSGGLIRKDRMFSIITLEYCEQIQLLKDPVSKSETSLISDFVPLGASLLDSLAIPSALNSI